MADREVQDKFLDAKVEGCGLSRREFLRNAGFVIGGASLGSLAFLNACSSGSSSTVTKTVTTTAGAGTTVTVTSPAVTVTGTGTATTPSGIVHLIINGIDYYGHTEPQWTLAYVMREKLGIIGTKRGCDMGDCGVCVVLMNGRPVMSCIVLATEADSIPIQTIEALAPAQGTKLDVLQQAWVDNDAMQCGFCTAGQIMTAKALLAFKPKPTDAEIKEFMAGTICRCGAYYGIMKAIKSVAGTT
jgi:aerobic-type carbon monoxide dehydrogenase small subunit (CoxS/CutS family)